MQDSTARETSPDETAVEGQRVARALRATGLPARLLGGVAVWIRSPSMRVAPLRRTYGDFDLVVPSSARSALTRFLVDQGYEPDRRFNALHGASRLIFADPRNGRRIDVIIDRFAMCHTIDLRDQVTIESETIPLADLLVTKLQIVELNEKDLRDSLALLADHDIGEAPDEISPSRIQELTRDDWGLERTMRGTLEKIRERAASLGLPPETLAIIRGRVDRILASLDAAPKSMRWKMRARIGERVRWYELPEEVR